MADTAGGESKFGFKDGAKATETLELLESHDMQYRKLTVRGLLGRAKRVLSMTKAEDKVRNISEAIKIFEAWLEENGGGAANKNATTDKEDKVEPVPGLGFKDKAAAQHTLKVLAERDPDYQRLAVKGLVGSSKRVLSGTKNEEKIASIQEGVQVLEDFLETFVKENRIKNNRAYLACALIEQLPAPEDELAAEFLQTYSGSKAKGNYKHLRTLYPSSDDSASWDIVRNRNIARILAKIEEEEEELFDDATGRPSDLHLELIHWAYSPQPEKLKAFAAKQTAKTAAKRKQSSSSSEDSTSEESGTESDEDIPKKKRK